MVVFTNLSWRRLRMAQHPGSWNGQDDSLIGLATVVVFSFYPPAAKEKGLTELRIHISSSIHVSVRRCGFQCRHS